VIDAGHRSLEAITASAMLARLLEMKPREPILAIESVGRDASRRVVEYFQAWHRADRTRLEIDVIRGNRQRSGPPALA
jgi:GntR family transcriptional regulator